MCFGFLPTKNILRAPAKETIGICRSTDDMLESDIYTFVISPKLICCAHFLASELGLKVNFGSIHRVGRLRTEAPEPTCLMMSGKCEFRVEKRPIRPARSR